MRWYYRFWGVVPLRYYPLMRVVSLCDYLILFEPQLIDGRLGITFGRHRTDSGNETLVLETLQRAGEVGAAGDAAAVIQAAAIAGGDALEELVEGDGVRTLLEAEGASHDVERDAQLRLGEVTHHLVEEDVRNLRIVRFGEPREPIAVARVVHANARNVLTPIRAFATLSLAEGTGGLRSRMGAKGRSSFFGGYRAGSIRPYRIASARLKTICAIE